MPFGTTISPGLLQLAVAEGATTPIPIGNQPTIVWSTTVSKVLVWNGSAWTATSGLNAMETAAISVRTKDVIDPRDWIGFDLTGSNDNSSILQAVIDEAAFKFRSDLGFGASKRLRLPSGRIAFSTQLLLKQSLYCEGSYGVAGGTELWWTGGDSVTAITNTAGLETSFLRLENFRLEDKRTAPTSGRGISILDINNGVQILGIQVMQFPLEQIYVGAPPGQASDCVEIHNVWATSQKTTAKGILIERIDNQVSLSHIKSDLVTNPANDGYVIRCEVIPNDSCVIRISDVKHESNNRCPTLSFPSSTRGNVVVQNVVQRNPQGGAAGAGDIVQVGASASGSAFVFNNSASGRTTGATSETGGRMLVQNVAGANHTDWTGATGAATIRMVGSSSAVYGPVINAQIGSAGRVQRSIAGNGQPNGSVYGNVGDEYSMLDGSSASAVKWIKGTGNGTNTSWRPLSSLTQSLAFAATFASNLQLGNRVVVGSLTANITISAPTNIPVFDTAVVYEFTQDGTGGRTITWSSVFKGAAPTASGIANQKQRVEFISDGTNLIFVGASGWY